MYPFGFSALLQFLDKLCLELVHSNQKSSLIHPLGVFKSLLIAHSLPIFFESFV